MGQILIVENEPRDAQFAERCAVQCGFPSVVKTPSAEAARALLEKARADESEMPDAILLDLDLGTESGFDFLRLRYESPWLAKIPLVVWTRLGDHNRSLCEVFKVQGYVSKSAGEIGLYKALESIAQQET
jgi:CheY-like chemotaxis protein